MDKATQKKITKIAKEFASGFKDTIGSINGSFWLIVDPMSGYLNFIGYKNELECLPENGKRLQVLILKFEDGSRFIPAGGDLKKEFPEAKNWMWINPD